MSAARFLTRLALVAGVATWTLGIAAPPVAAQDDAADPSALNEEDGADANVALGPVSHPMFSERAERHARFVERGGKAADTAVQLGLEWLKQHQNAGGYWDTEKFSSECKLNRCSGPGGAVSDTGVTGAALLAFLGAGETPAAGRYQDIVTRGLEYLSEQQDAEGCFGSREGTAWLHDHMWAAHAMTEAYGMTGSPRWKDTARRAVLFTLSAENPYLGWGAGVRDGTNNTTMTALAMSVLHTAAAADLLEREPEEAHRGAYAWITKVTEPDSGRIGDVSRGGTGDPTTFPQLRGLAPTAAGLVARVLAGEPSGGDDTWKRGAALVRAEHPSRAIGEEHAEPDFTLWLWCARAMYESGGSDWRAWNGPLAAALVAAQRRETGRDERGSWDTADDHASEGGRVFVTAVGCITLEVAYRHPRAFDERR